MRCAVGALNHIPRSKRPWIRSAEIGIDGDSTVGAQVQMAPHQVHTRLPSELEDDTLHVEPAPLAGTAVQHFDALEVIRTNERVEVPAGHLRNETL